MNFPFASFQLPRAREVVSAEVLDSFFSRLGILASSTYKQSKNLGGAYIYSLFLSFLICGIETGLEASMLTTLLVLGYLSQKLGSSDLGGKNLTITYTPISGLGGYNHAL